MNIFFEYPKCTTCKKAKKFLDENNIEYVDRNIKLDKPSYDELKEYFKESNLDINKLFNTSGLVYKELSLREKLVNMSVEEKLKLLASDGMLVKRPIFVSNNKTYFGFKEIEWEKIKED